MEFVDYVIALIALGVSVGLAAALLLRQRAHAQPVDPETGVKPPVKVKANRQERLMAKLEPLPEIPTLMDLVREEVAETGVDQLPGHEGLTGPVMLKVFRRDEPVKDRCTHESYGFVVAEGVDPALATEDEVILFCEQCGPENVDQDSAE